MAEHRISIIAAFASTFFMSHPERSQLFVLDLNKLLDTNSVELGQALLQLILAANNHIS